MSEAIVFDASVYKVQTLADNGIRVTLDMPEQSFEALAKLAACQQAHVYLSIEATPIVREDLTVIDDGTQKEAKEGATQVGSRRAKKQRDKRSRGSL